MCLNALKINIDIDSQLIWVKGKMFKKIFTAKCKHLNFKNIHFTVYLKEKLKAKAFCSYLEVP